MVEEADAAATEEASTCLSVFARSLGSASRTFSTDRKCQVFRQRSYSQAEAAGISEVAHRAGLQGHLQANRAARARREPLTLPEAMATS